MKKKKCKGRFYGNYVELSDKLEDLTEKDIALCVEKLIVKDALGLDLDQNAKRLYI